MIGRWIGAAAAFAMLVGCGTGGYPAGSARAPLPAPAYVLAIPIPAVKMRPADHAPRALVSTVDALVRAFPGTAGVAIRAVDDGWTVQSNGRQRLPQQSVSKLWVAMALLDLRDSGRIRLDDPVTITRDDLTLFHQPIAWTVAKGGSYTTTVDNLLYRALTHSDNTANDRLLTLIGGPRAVRDFIERKQLGDIRFGPGERLLQARTAGLTWAQPMSVGNSFEIARSRLSPEVRQAAMQAYIADPPDGAAPLAIADALARLARGELLSETSTRLLLTTMSESKTGRARLKAAIPMGWQLAHKTGTGQELGRRNAGFNDVGLVTAPDGRRYAVAVMIGDTMRPMRERQQLIQSVASALTGQRAAADTMAAADDEEDASGSQRLVPCVRAAISAPMPHLYLVDGSGYIFRAYHRLPPLTNKHDEPVGAVYGYTSMLWKLADALHKADGLTHMAVILDKSSHTFRNELYDQYKAHRPPPPEDLVPQFPMIRDATRAFSLPCIEEEGLEADDIIACYTQAALAQGWRVTIVSSDKDLMQLMADPSVDMLDTMNNRTLGPEYVVEKFGVGPDKLGDVLALMGDSVDNVPGVTGVGPKTASKLINEYGDLEGVLAAAPTMKPGKLRDNLIEQAANARLSKVLVTLKCDAPLPQPLDELDIKGIPEAPLRAFLEHHGFKTLLARLGQVADAPQPAAANVPVEEDPPCDHDSYETVVDEAALDRWISVARHQGFVAIDSETTAKDPMLAELVGVSMALHPNLACYVPLGHGGSDMFAKVPVQLDRAVALDKLKPLLEDPAVLKIGHNLKYDLIVLSRCGIDVAPYDDTIVMSFDLDAGLHGHGMDELAATHLSHSCIAYKDVTGSGKKAIGFHEVDLKAATRYAAEDADVTLRLWRRFRPRLPVEAATRVYEMVDRPLPAVVARMERHGIKVDRDRLAALSADFTTQIAAREEEIHALAGVKFTIGSPKQLGDVLFDKMGIKGGRKGKSGVYSTDVNELERIAADKDLPNAAGREMVVKVLDWRQLTKLKNTYTDALQEQINTATGRVHTSYSLTGAQTGRLSSTDPNLQNIPIRTEVGRQIRDAFVAEDGHVILAADYSQIELRLAAHMADVPALKEAFANGDDIHSLTATELFGEVNRDTRARAKTINFAILYGISRWGLAGRLDVTPDEAQGMIDRYFDRFPGINRYIAETLTQVRERGFTTTLFGRKTHFPRIRSKVQHERQGAERAAINAPIQGTSADIIKRAMARMEPALAAAGLRGTRMLLQVHDELVFEVPADEVDAARPLIERVMATAAEPSVVLDVPLAVEIGVGESWGAAH